MKQYLSGGIIKGRIVNNKKYDFYLSEERLEDLYKYIQTREKENCIFAKFAVTSINKISILANGESAGDIYKYLDKILIDGVQIDLDYFSYDETLNKTDFVYAKTIRYPISVGTHEVRYYYKKEINGIYNSAFEGCDRLISIILPNNIEYIGYNAFSGCERINTISLPENIKIIRKNAFYKCSGLTSVNLSSGIKIIEDCAFSGCKLLTPIDTSNIKLGSDVFEGCLNFKN